MGKQVSKYQPTNGFKVDLDDKNRKNDVIYIRVTKIDSKLKDY